MQEEAILTPLAKMSASRLSLVKCKLYWKPTFVFLFLLKRHLVICFYTSTHKYSLK